MVVKWGKSCGDNCYVLDSIPTITLIFSGQGRGFGDVGLMATWLMRLVSKTQNTEAWSLKPKSAIIWQETQSKPWKWNLINSVVIKKMKPYVNPKQTLNKPKRVGPTRNLWASLGSTPGLDFTCFADATISYDCMILRVLLQVDEWQNDTLVCLALHLTNNFHCLHIVAGRAKNTYWYILCIPLRSGNGDISSCWLTGPQFSRFVNDHLARPMVHPCSFQRFPNIF